MRRSVQLIAGLLVAVAAGGCGDAGGSDRGATERMFLETCAPGGEPEEQAVCRCAFERLTAELSDDELEELDRSVRGNPEAMPSEVTEAALRCAAEPLTPPAPPPSTTSTTTDGDTSDDDTSDDDDSGGDTTSTTEDEP